MTYLPTPRDEEWRYADPEALAQLAPADLDVWHEATLAPGETRSKTLILDEKYPGLHRVRLTVGEGARAEIFAVGVGECLHPARSRGPPGARRAFRVRRRDHRRRRGDPRVRHPDDPCRARGNLRTRSCARSTGAARRAISSAGSMSRAMRRRPTRRRISRACCSSAAPRPMPSPSSRSSPTTSSAPTARRSARWTRPRGSTWPRGDSARGGEEAAGVRVRRRCLRRGRGRGRAGSPARRRARGAGECRMSTAPALDLPVDRKADFPGLRNADGSPWHYLDSGRDRAEAAGGDRRRSARRSAPTTRPCTAGSTRARPR